MFLNSHYRQAEAPPLPVVTVRFGEIQSSPLHRHSFAREQPTSRGLKFSP
jgi:hypothetical protein